MYQNRDNDLQYCFHNHNPCKQPTVDLLAMKKLHVAENKKVLNDFLFINDLTHSKLPTYLKNSMKDSYCWHLKYKLKQNYNDLQYIMANGNTFKDLKLIYKVDDSICTSIFMYHEVVQLPILQSYSFSLDRQFSHLIVKMNPCIHGFSIN